jgi:MgtC family
MPTFLGWQEVGLRLALTVVAGLVVGLDRERRGKPVGLRTTVLVCLAASVSMIQANLLLPTSGKTDGSFATQGVVWIRVQNLVDRRSLRCDHAVPGHAIVGRIANPSYREIRTAPECAMKTLAGASG